MKSKKTIIIFQILKNSFLWKAFCIYLIAFAIISFVFLLAEPSINSYYDAVWYSFVSCTTIGFGDFAAVTVIGRIATVFLYIYTVLIIALTTAVFTQFFIEIAKARRDDSIALIQHDLEHLSELPKERLEEISEKIRDIKQ